MMLAMSYPDEDHESDLFRLSEVPPDERQSSPGSQEGIFTGELEQDSFV